MKGSLLIEARRSPLSQRATEITAKRMRIERVELFKRVAFAEKALREMLDYFTGKITAAVQTKGRDMKNAAAINHVIHTETVTLRASMRAWVGAAIRDSAKMGFRHIGDALLPVFKHNRESMEQTILAERAIFESTIGIYPAAERVFFEGKLVFAMNTAFAAAANPAISFSDQKWADATAAIIKRITAGNVKGSGLRPSERVWDLTTRSEQDLKRIVVNGMANGENPAVIARKIKQYVSPAAADASELGVSVGPGVYRSPYANAMRLARTEMNKTYVASQVAFARDKDWVVGMEITLSPIHEEEDECDDLAAGGPYTPEEVLEYIPAHPHCVMGDTNVSLLDGKAALRSIYSGEIFEVGLSDGRRVSITANHMMLTTRGFIKAQSLMESDEIIDGSLIDGEVPCGPYDHRMPTRAAEVFESLAKTQSMAAIRVPVSSEHLHGDGRFCQGEIDIVGADRLLGGRKDALASQRMSQFRFSSTYSNLPAFPREGQLRQMLQTIARAFPYAMRGLGIPATPCRALTRQPQALSVGGRAQLDSATQEPLSYRGSAHADAIGKLLNRFAGYVATAKIAFIDRRVVRRMPVFDFHTTSSLYLVEGLVSSNCMCHGTPIIDPAYLGEDPNAA